MHGMISTDCVPNQDRSAFWRAVVDEHYVEVDLDMPKNRGFRGALAYSALPRLRLTRYIASPNSARRRATQAARASRDDLFCFFPARGEMHFEQHGRNATAAPGTICLIDGTAPFRLTQPGRIDVTVARLARRLLEDCVPNLGLYTCHQIAAHQGLPSIASGFMTSVAREAGNVGVALERAAHLSSHAIDLLAMCLLAPDTTAGMEAGDSSVRRAHLLRARHRIAADLGEPSLTPATLAASLGISQRYLHALFADQGKTPGRAILAARLDRAREHLSMRPAPPVSSVACRVGFVSAAHFARAFKARFGMCPRDVGTLPTGID